MSKSMQQDKKYKIAGIVTLILSFGIYMTGGATQAVISMEPQQFKVIMFVGSLLTFINAGFATYIAIKLRNKGNTVALAAVITSIVMGLISFGGASLIGLGN